MDEKKVTGRRKFLFTTFKSIIVTRALPGLLSTSLMSCSSLQATGSGVGEKELKKLQLLMTDKNNPLKWVFTGDSITQGAKHTSGFRSYPEIFSEHVKFEMGRARDIVINTAISGNATTDILKDFDWRIGQFKPQVVSIMIGTNDAASSRNISVEVFENNLRSLIKKFRDINAIPIINTPNTILPGERPDKNERMQLPLYVAAIRRVARKMQTIFVDHWSYWENNQQKVNEEIWMADPLHPDGRGHLEMARQIFSILGICKDQSFTCAGTVRF